MIHHHIDRVVVIKLRRTSALETTSIMTVHTKQARSQAGKGTRGNTECYRVIVDNSAWIHHLTSNYT